MYQPILLPCSDTTMNCMKFKLEAMNVYIYPFRTSNAHNALRHGIPELLCKFPTAVLEKAHTHSIMSFASHVKFHLIDSYCSECVIPQCYICARST